MLHWNLNQMRTLNLCQLKSELQNLTSITKELVVNQRPIRSPAICTRTHAYAVNLCIRPLSHLPLWPHLSWKTIPSPNAPARPCRLVEQLRQ